MNLSAGMTDEALLLELGQRLAQFRIQRNLTQAALAESAGVSLRTLARLETGKTAVHLSAFLRVCRALGLLERVNAMIAEPGPAPLALLRQRRGTTRRRVRPRKESGQKEGPWTWGETK